MRVDSARNFGWTIKFETDMKKFIYNIKIHRETFSGFYSLRLSGFIFPD